MSCRILEILADVCLDINIYKRNTWINIQYHSTVPSWSKSLHHLQSLKAQDTPRFPGGHVDHFVEIKVECNGRELGRQTLEDILEGNLKRSHYQKHNSAMCQRSLLPSLPINRPILFLRLSCGQRTWKVQHVFPSLCVCVFEMCKCVLIACLSIDVCILLYLWEILSLMYGQ